jgi:WD40 repeat protein
MPDSPRQRVFISYARKDAAKLAVWLQENLKPEYDVWLDTAQTAGGMSWTVAIENAIDNTDAVLALLTPGSYSSDICRAEQLRALRRGKRVIPLLAAAGTDVPLHLETKDYLDFTGANPNHEQLKQLRVDIRTGRNAADLQARFSRTPVTAPPLPRTYIERPQTLEQLCNAVIVDDPGPSIALIALKGMGGIGKTILAQALTCDEVVQQAFPDGVAWTTVGKEASLSLTTRMQEVRRALGDEPSREESELQCINSYRTLLQQKAALVIVDDIWQTADIEPFLAESRRSRLLFTTRDSAIAAAVGAVEHTAELLTSEQSRTLLARCAGCNEAALPAEASALIHECGRLPLALSVIGAMLRSKPPSYWSHVLALLCRAELGKIRAHCPFYPHADLLRAIQVSVEALDASARVRYLALAVLLDDMPAAPSVQRTLWNVDQGEALETAEQFVSLSLAQRDADGEGIRLHDLQLDYVRSQYPDREALALIHAALRLSSHIITRDPAQFASQMAGRLLAYIQPEEPLSATRQWAGFMERFTSRQKTSVQQFSTSIVKAAPRPWLRSIRPTLYPPDSGLVRTLEGHSSTVWSTALSEDGQRAVSASYDNTLKVWDVNRGRELYSLDVDFDFGLFFRKRLAVSTDGRRAVSNSPQGVKVWNLETGRQLPSVTCATGLNATLAMSGDARYMVSAPREMVELWDLEIGRKLRTLTGHSCNVLDVAVSRDGRRAVSVSWDNTARLWDLETGSELRTLAADLFYKNVNVAVSGDGRRAVFATSRTLTVWDLEAGHEMHIEHGHLQRRAEVGDPIDISPVAPVLAVSGDGRRAVSAAAHDLTLKLWDLETGHELRTLTGHSAGVLGVAMSGDGRLAVSGSKDGTLKIWNLGTRLEPWNLTGHRSEVLGVAVSGDGRWAVSVSDWELKVWDLETARELRALAGDFRLMAVSENWRRAVSVSYHRTLLAHLLGRTGFRLKVWSMRTGRKLRTLRGHTDMVNGVSLSADGLRAVSASDDKTLKVWNEKTGRELHTLAGHSDVVNAVAISGDGRSAVSASEDCTLKVWDLETGREVHTLTSHSAGVNSVAVSKDGRRAVSASSREYSLKVWDLETGREVHTMTGHLAGVNGVAVSGDGRRVATVSEDHTLRVWYLDNGKLVATFTCDVPVRCCAFAGRSRIVAGDMSGRVHFLSLELSEDY